MEEIRADIKAGKLASLYLDYPIGVDPDGFDAQAFSHLFLQGYSVGAPPDKAFNRGQNWGFRPFDPKAMRQDKFAYLRETIRHYLAYAGMIRLDHIMGFYRIFCVPDKQSAAKGVYIHYPFEAIMALFCLEAARHQATIIGEDLGTVPDAVKHAMKDHGMYRMWLLPFEAKEDLKNLDETIDPHMLACMNTHDLFPLRAFVECKDIKMLVDLELADKEDAKKMKKDRKNILNTRDFDSVFSYALEEMAKSPAHCVLLNIEDIWGEVKPQNIPGTSDEYPNWRKRFSYLLEEWHTRPRFHKAISILNKYRKAD